MTIETSAPIILEDYNKCNGKATICLDKKTAEEILDSVRFRINNDKLTPEKLERLAAIYGELNSIRDEGFRI